MTRKKNIAKSAGYLQLTLAVFGFIEVIRRFLGMEAVPAFQTMIIISILALIGNGLCLYLLQKSKSKEAHMQASMIFTSNDVIVNLGVIVAGGLVYLTNSKYPDLIVGTIVFFIVGQGAFKILKLSKWRTKKNHYCQQRFCVMAGDVLNWTVVLLKNGSAKLKVCASKSATTQSRKTLAAILNDTTYRQDNG